MARRRSRVLTVAVFTAVLTSVFWLSWWAWWSQPERRAPPLPSQTAEKDQPRFPLDRSDDPPARRHADSKAQFHSQLAIPVAGITAEELTDTFSEARAGGTRRHDAIDISAPLGTPVVAAGTGKVEKLFYSKAGGNTVYIRSLDGSRIHYYAHLHTYAPGVSEGDTVLKGDQIGTVGVTGNASPEAPHLHFEVMATTPERAWHEESAALNPYPLLTGREVGPQLRAPARGAEGK